MDGARSEGAEVFLAPAGNCKDVVGNIPDGMEVFSVETLDEAVEAVRAVGSGGDRSELDTCEAQ